jgi:hypothetical protein
MVRQGWSPFEEAQLRERQEWFLLAQVLLPLPGQEWLPWEQVLSRAVQLELLVL